MTSRARTSTSSPLRIAEVAAGHGFLGITLCPGKKGDSVLGGPAWERDLDVDVAAIQAWGAAAVVTLIEPREIELLAVQGLPAALVRAGIEWHHLPIPDGGTADLGFEIRWQYAGARLRQRLRDGERVLVHCRGGLGRAGSIASRLLIELGLAPAEAMSRVRAARPGAIENEQQERWVLAQRPVDEARDRRSASELACLLGGALGDALGYRVEFDTLPAIRAKHGPDGIRLSEARGPLVVSDDTQMTLFTLEGQAEAFERRRPILECVREAYLRWYQTQRSSRSDAAVPRQGLLAYPSIWRTRAPGTTCMTALAKGGQGTVERPINDSKGCGGVMRTAPLGFLPRGVEDLDLCRHGAAAAALTHGHPDGYVPAGAMALAVRLLLEGAPQDRILAMIGQEAMREYPAARGTGGLVLDVGLALSKGPDVRRAPEFGLGWVGDEAFAVGLYAALAASSYEAAIEAAANHDGDSDSTASIAGQLYGARHGLTALPAEAVYRLDVLEPLLATHRRWRESLDVRAP